MVPGKNNGFFAFIRIFILLFLGFFTCFSQTCSRERKSKPETESKTNIYHCPMHPNYVSDKPGDCPICGMKLVPVEKKEPTRKENKSKSSEQKTLYYCPMHPDYISDKPGNCPICGMKLVPMEKEIPGEEKHIHEGELHYRHEHKKESLADGFEITRIPIGLKFVKVESKNISKEIRGAGTVELDERRIKSIHLKYSGWIEDLYADYEWKFISKGEPLLKIYSPELAASVQDYIISMEAYEKFRKDHAQSDFYRSLFESSKRKLEIYGLSEKDIVEFEGKLTEERKNISPYIIMRSPISGFIIKKNVFRGQFVSPETELFRIADLSNVWVIAEFYENDIKNIKKGYRAVVKSDILGFEIQGKISYIFPHIDPQRRTLKVRIDVENKSLVLKPGMYVSVSLHIPIGKKIFVPDGSVLWSGEKYYVFVKGEGEKIIAREVVLGDKIKDGYIVERGLIGDEEIVASGTFFVDSETKLKSAIEIFKQEQEKKEEEHHIH